MDGVALASVVVSGVVGICGIYVAASGPRNQHRHDREMRLRDERRTAYVEFISAASRARKAALNVSRFGPPSVDSSEREDLRGQVLREIHAMINSRTTVEVVGPPEVAATVRRVSREVQDGALAAMAGGPVPQHPDGWIAMISAIRRDLGYEP